MESPVSVDNPVQLENRVEGPQLKVEAHIPMKDYLKQWGPNPTTWVYDQIEEQLPKGELKKAMAAVIEERDARIKAKGSYLDPILTDEVKKYAFRGIKRRSDNLPSWEHPEATLDSVDDNLHTYGIDAPGPESARNIMSGFIWEMYTFPNPNELENSGLDVSIITVYRNEPYVLPTKSGDAKVMLFKPRGSESKDKWEEISIDEAKEKRYPTLRDIYIGQIEVHFDKEKKWQIPQIFQRKQK
jgi:hypothetical protein